VDLLGAVSVASAWRTGSAAYLSQSRLQLVNFLDDVIKGRAASAQGYSPAALNLPTLRWRPSCEHETVWTREGEDTSG
jgi:hypothetical protein